MHRYAAHPGEQNGIPDTKIVADRSVKHWAIPPDFAVEDNMFAPLRLGVRPAGAEPLRKMAA
jgi:hypothetical protein